MEFLLDKMRGTGSNEEFLETMNSKGPLRPHVPTCRRSRTRNHIAI
jgi:hypothetical protein